MSRLIAALLAVLVASALLLVLSARPGTAAGTARTITVTGIGQASVAPDEALVTLGTTSEAPSAAEAFAQLRTATARLRSALRHLNIPAADIATTSLSLNPTYSQSGARTGFTASLLTTITVPQVSLVPSVVDDAVAEGANEVEGISFLASNPNTGVAQAIAEASRAAADEAKALAASLHASLGPAVASTATTMTAQPVPLAFPFQVPPSNSAHLPAIPVSPGTEKVAVTLKVTYMLR